MITFLLPRIQQTSSVFLPTTLPDFLSYTFKIRYFISLFILIPFKFQIFMEKPTPSKLFDFVFWLILILLLLLISTFENKWFVIIITFSQTCLIQELLKNSDWKKTRRHSNLFFNLFGILKEFPYHLLNCLTKLWLENLKCTKKSVIYSNFTAFDLLYVSTSLVKILSE